MAIPHAQPGQPVDIRPFGPRLAQQQTVALFKSQDLEVMRVVLPAGKSLPPHHVPGEITVQCIEGEVEVSAEGRTQALASGQVLYLRRSVMHSLIALRDASLLVTIALR